MSSGCKEVDNLDINHTLIMLIRADGCRQTELIKRTTHVMSLPWMQQTIDSSACHLVKIKIDTKRKIKLPWSFYYHHQESKSVLKVI